MDRGIGHARERLDLIRRERGAGVQQAWSIAVVGGPQVGDALECPGDVRDVAGGIARRGRDERVRSDRGLPGERVQGEGAIKSSRGAELLLHAHERVGALRLGPPRRRG
ncbi:MAG: hypothetical protein AAGB34_07335, partial [Planctomycetota bacterium]